MEVWMVRLGEGAVVADGLWVEKGLGRLVFDALYDATAVVDEAGVIVAVNSAWERFRALNGGSAGTCGVGVDYLAVCTIAAASGSEEALLVAEGMRDVLAGTRAVFELEYPCPSHDEDRWFLERITPLPGWPGAVVSHVDITRRKQAELAAAGHASRDPLTGLLNRRSITAEEDAGGAVLFIDLDGFKAVNDTLGHPAGDEVLARVANRIVHHTRPTDRVVRFGGDEFVVLLSDNTPDSPEAVATRIADALSAPYQLGPEIVRITASVGIAHRAAGEPAAAVLARADQAMFEIKRTRPGRGRVAP
jgi:diguanylate cyclase (GGDEF)-like protein